MLSQQQILNKLSENLNSWKSQYGVIHIALFGSYSQEKQTQNSDIDILVEFNASSMTFDNYMNLKFQLEDMFDKKVDLVIINDIKPTLKTNILRDAIYA